MTNSLSDANEIAVRLHRLSGLNQTQIDALSLTLDPVQVDQVSDAVLAQLVNGTLPGLPTNPTGGLPLGLPGATSAARFVGGTVSGPPTTGTFQARDFVLDAAGMFWICTAGGTPGTWVDAAQADALAAIPTPTGVKTGSYTAAANQLIPVDTTSGNVTVTLPTAPADKTRVTIKHVVQGGTNTVTIARGGSTDVFNKAGGSTSLSLSTLNQAMTVQYQASSHIWYVVNDSLTPAAVVALGTGTYRVKGGLLAALPARWYYAHRGFGQVAPENTMEAGRMAVSQGAHLLDLDTWPLTDGSIGCMHDLTVDRTTTSSGTVTDLDSGSFQSLVIDAGAQRGDLWGNLKPPLLSQIAGEFGYRIPLSVQVKPFTGAGAGLLAQLQRLGLGPDTVFTSSFLLAELAPLAAAGYRNYFVTTAANRAASDPATLAAAGVTGVGLDMSDSALTASQAAKNAEIARWHAVGIRVLVYSPIRRSDLSPWITAGVDDVAADEPLYLRPDWVPRATDPFKSGTFPHGMISGGAYGTGFLGSRGGFIGQIGSARWTDTLSGARFTTQGWGCPIPGVVETTLQGAVTAGATTIVVGPENKPLAGKALTIDPAGTPEVRTPSADGVLNSDGTYTVTVPALSSSHASGVRVFGGTWSIDYRLTFDANGTDTSRWAGIVVGQPSDRFYSDGATSNNDNGYLCALRVTGALFVNGRVLTTSISGAPAAATSAAISAPLVLSSGLAAATPITALPVNATASAIVAGQQFMLPNGQIATASGSATSGATSVPINSLTPTAAVASGVSVPQTVALRVQRTATQLILTRLDTSTAVTWTDTTWFGGYFAFGQNQTTGLQVSWSNVTITPA